MNYNDIYKKLQKEEIKMFLKNLIDYNPNLNFIEKEIRKQQLDEAADKADRIEDIMKLFWG